MMRNVHFFDLAPGADERRALELWDGVLAEFALARGCKERRTLKLYDVKKADGVDTDPIEPAQFMNESVWPDVETSMACFAQEPTPEFTAAREELQTMIIMKGSVRYITP